MTNEEVANMVEFAVAMKMEDLYTTLVDLQFTYFRISTGELNLFPKDSKATKTQKKDILKTRLDAIQKEIDALLKSIKALEKFEKTTKK